MEDQQEERRYRRPKGEKNEESRLQIDELNRQNILLQNQKHNQYPIPIQQTIDHRYELDDVYYLLLN